MMRRLVLPVVLVGLVALPAAALEIDEMLDEGDGAFSGTGVVMCTWGADSAAATYDVTRRDGMSMVHGPEGDLMLGGGLSASWTDDASSAIELGGWGSWEMSDRYTVVESSVERLGRPAVEALVFEDGIRRVRMIVDDATTIPLLTEVYTGDGTLYRIAALVEFSPDVPDMPMPGDMPEHEMLMPTEPSPWLPGETAGYRRVDTYEMGGMVQAYYSDGLFSFSVFEADRGPVPEAFDEATTFVSDSGARYRRIVTPTVVWVHWDAPDRSYVLVGDLPPDHLTTVLTDLPEPGRRNLIVRMWRRLFG